jgi:hypothetical protein
LFEKEGPNLILPNQLELRAQIEKSHFGWMQFSLYTNLKVFMIHLVDPLMNTTGYMISFIKADELSTGPTWEDNKTPRSLLNTLQISYNTSEKDALKNIQDFVCRRFKIEPADFLGVLKKKSSLSRLSIQEVARETTVSGEYFQSHESRNQPGSLIAINLKSQRGQYARLNTGGPGMQDKDGIKEGDPMTMTLDDSSMGMSPVYRNNTINTSIFRNNHPYQAGAEKPIESQTNLASSPVSKPVSKDKDKDANPLEPDVGIY